jgi:branched-chain amino acid aminotransferase
MTRDVVYISDEAFFTGTAAEVTPIRELDRIALGKGDYVGTRGPITKKIQSAFFDIVNGRNPKYSHWLAHV